MQDIPAPVPSVSGIDLTQKTRKISALTYLAWFKEQFDRQILIFLEEKRREAQEINPDAMVLVEELIRFTKNGGKRVRPAFLYSGYVASGGKAHEAALFTSMAVEMLHVFALIHDDIIDNSDLRRGEPTTHKQFETFHTEQKLNGNKKDYALSAAILAGDLAYSFAEEIMTAAPFPQERMRRARYYFDQMKTQVIYGEYLDVLGGYKKSLTEDEVLQILEYKTAKYTVERPLHIGAMLAGADFKIIQTFSSYGIPFGQAFQMQDDLVGTFGTEEEIGKPNDSDIKEGKKTILLAKAYEWSNKAQKEILDSNVGKKDANPKEIEQVRKIMKETGAYDYCVKLAKELLSQAETGIRDIKLTEEGKSYLLAAVDYLNQRL